MPHRSRKDTMAICGRSGIETLKSKLVQDGYMRGLWVLPDYYEPPQPIKYRPKPEVPPYNPQPLIDIYKTTVTLGPSTGGLTIDTIGNAAYSATNVGTFTFTFGVTVNLGGVVCDTAVGHISNGTGILLGGVQCDTAVGQFERGIEGWGAGGWGSGPWGGDAEGFGENVWGQFSYGGVI